MICWAIYIKNKMLIHTIKKTKRQCVNFYLMGRSVGLYDWETCRKVVVKKWEKD